MIPTGAQTSPRSGPPLPRVLSSVLLAVAMFAFGFGVYNAAGYLKAGRAPVQRPDQVSAPVLPGTMYVAQGGAIYRFHGGSFTQITSEAGWTQPAVSADGGLLAVVKRSVNWSDLYLMTPYGRTTAQRTQNRSSQVEGNHWAFYPRFSPDGRQLFYAYDPKDPYNTYRVDLAVFASPTDPASQASVMWTYPNPYTGGDVNPLPLSDGSLIFTKFSIDDQSAVHSQLWLQARPGSAGAALTDASLDCGQAAVSRDQKRIAMVCTRGQTRAAELDVATFDAATRTFGAPVTLVSGRLASSPVFSPDGRTVAYLAPAAAGGMFQLWTVPAAGHASPTQITTDLGLDSTSAPAWTD